MSFVLRDGVAFLHSDDFIGKAVDGLDATLIAAGWERSTKGDEVSGALGATDRVYWSSGESGKESIYLRVTQTTADNIDFRAYSFWDPATNTGYHEAGNAAGATRLVGQNAAMVGWLAVDKNGVGLVLRTAAGVYRKAYCGILARQIAPQWNGQATISNAGGGAAAGQPNVKVTATSGFEAGQAVWIVNQAAGANAGNAERATILTVNSGTSIIQLSSNLANAYDDGALVALDPQPVALWCAGNTEVFAAGNRYMLSHADAYPGGLNAPFDQQTFLEEVGLNLFDPDDFGQYPVESFLLKDSTAGREWRRGYVNRFARTVSPGAGFTDESRILVGADIFMLMQETDLSWVTLKKTA